MDEELKRESEPFERGAPVESRVEDHREVEEASRPREAAEGSARGEPEARAELTRFLQPSIFPADRATVLQSARSEGATGAVLRELEALPEGVTFATAQEVWEALGGGRP